MIIYDDRPTHVSSGLSTSPDTFPILFLHTYPYYLPLSCLPTYVLFLPTLVYSSYLPTSYPRNFLPINNTPLRLSFNSSTLDSQEEQLMNHLSYPQTWMHSLSRTKSHYQTKIQRCWTTRTQSSLRCIPVQTRWSRWRSTSPHLPRKFDAETVLSPCFILMLHAYTHKHTLL